MAATLVCPRCASEHDGGERFCPQCGMPLVHVGVAEAAVSERQQRARKIKPQYAEGALVKVTYARNQAEAELIAGMLLEEGIPSLLRRAAAFDVPDFMAAGPRDVLLQEGETAWVPRASTSITRPTRVVAALLLAIALVAIVLFMATHVWD